MTDFYTHLHDRLCGGLELLPDKPEESVESTWRALWFAASGAPRSATFAMQGMLPMLSEKSAAELEHLVQRRISGEPLAHITGRQRFMDLEMLSSTQALIPRAETELLVRASIDLLLQPAASAHPTVIDVCTGSGNIAFAIASRVTNATVFGTDLSDEAIAFGQRNGRHLGLHERVQFRIGDLLEPFETTADTTVGDVDLIVCAPPYICSGKVEQMAIEISEHEPKLAFDGGPFGVTILMRLIEDAPRFLRPGGWLAMEVGLGQGPMLVKRLQRNADFDDVRGLTDASQAVRVILARRRCGGL
jgi:release factor glutamine methyltransferase